MQTIQDKDQDLATCWICTRLVKDDLESPIHFVRYMYVVVLFKFFWLEYLIFIYYKFMNELWLEYWISILTNELFIMIFGAFLSQIFFWGSIFL